MPQQPRRRLPPRQTPPHGSPEGATREQLSDAFHRLLAQSRLRHDERLDVLASALVVEALRPYWTDGRTPQEAHDALCRTDPELAAVIEALAPVLLGHIQVQEEAQDAIASVEALLGIDR